MQMNQERERTTELTPREGRFLLFRATVTTEKSPKHTEVPGFLPGAQLGHQNSFLMAWHQLVF